jgi:hypothetical protein
VTVAVVLMMRLGDGVNDDQGDVKATPQNVTRVAVDNSVVGGAAGRGGRDDKYW